MPICPKCNTQQPEGLNYCTKCGAGLGPVPAKKGIPAKGLLFGGCGCAILITILIGVVVVIALVMGSMQKQGPGATGQPPIVQPQPQPQPTPEPIEPAVPTEPTVPTQPIEQPQIPQVPTQPQPGGYPELKKGDFMILFAKGLTNDGLPIGTTTTFSRNDPQIIQVVRWGPNTVPVGAVVMWGWYYNNNTFVWGNYGYAQQGYVGVYDKVDRPASGFPAGTYTVMVAVNGTPAISHSFTVR